MEGTANNRIIPICTIFLCSVPFCVMFVIIIEIICDENTKNKMKKIVILGLLKSKKIIWWKNYYDNAIINHSIHNIDKYSWMIT